MKAVLITMFLIPGTVLLGVVAYQRTAGSFIATLPTAQAECDYVQSVVARLHAQIQRADRLTREGALARAPSGRRKPGGCTPSRGNSTVWGQRSIAVRRHS